MSFEAEMWLYLHEHIHDYERSVLKWMLVVLQRQAC